MYDFKPEHEFTRDERILTQHLANQMAIALRLLEGEIDSRAVVRSEKLAAVGQSTLGHRLGVEAAARQHWHLRTTWRGWAAACGRTHT